MGTRDPRIDAYIVGAPEFARPILGRIRDLVHQACPEVAEALKWGHPAFLHQGLICGMAAFKQHCALNFWKAELVVGSSPADRKAMGQFGRLTSLRDLPSDRILTRYLRRAVELNQAGTPRRRAAAPRAEPETPPALLAALRRTRGGVAGWRQLSPSQRRDYAEWITEAKREETRARRIATAVEWIAQGKGRNWKYEQRQGGGR